jgi:DNA invertase Pin-like site-specific DNA recombinase
MINSTASVKGRSKAWTYLVVSSEQQVETIPYQRRWAAEVALQHSWTITETFEGVSSGKDGTRALLKKLVDRLEKTPRQDRPERVLMIRLDRLGRGLGLEALAALAQITQLGVTVHTRQDGDYKIARASDSLLPLMRIVTGGIENEARRDKALDTYKRRRLNGLAVSNKRAYGIKVVEGRDVVCEPEAGAVRLAFELAANGFGYWAIGTRLTAVAPPKRYASGRIHETNWTNDRVRKLLHTKAYRGVVIDERQWDRVHRLLSHPPDVRVRINPWPLSGALHCICGRILIGSQRGSPSKRVYRCAASKVHGKCLTYPAVRLEQQFSDLLKSLTATPKLMREYAKQSSRLVELDERALRERHRLAFEGIDRAEIERTRIWKLNADGLLPDVHLARKLTDVDQQITTYRTVMAEVEIELQRNDESEKEQGQAQALLRDAVSSWESAAPTDQAAAARALARALRGLCVLEDGTLQIGPPTEWKRFFKAKVAAN